MEIKIHARKIDNKLRTALYAMTEFAMADLIPSERLRNNVSINVHLKHHEEDGEAMLEEYANRYRPREFKVIVDHHRAEIDDYGRTRTDTEWGHTILRILAHELVHVKQYLMGELTFKKGQMCWKKQKVDFKSGEDYYFSPHEVEAYGREKGLLVSFFIKWKEIEEKMGMKYSLNKEK